MLKPTGYWGESNGKNPQSLLLKKTIKGSETEKCRFLYEYPHLVKYCIRNLQLQVCCAFQLETNRKFFLTTGSQTVA